mgnify:CR=1 FL=1
MHGPGISGLVMRIPGAKWVTASPNWEPQGRLGGGCATGREELPRSSIMHDAKGVDGGTM